MKTMAKQIVVPLAVACCISGWFGCGPRGDDWTGEKSDANPTELAFLDTLRVESDGTVSLEDESAARMLLGGDFDSAIADVESLNGKIRSGEEDGFRDSSALYEYEGMERPIAEGDLAGSSETGSLGTEDTVRGSQPRLCMRICCKKLWFVCFRYCPPRC